jgi:hypothetical protein
MKKREPSMATKAAARPANPPSRIADQLRGAIVDSGETLYRVAVGSGVVYPIVFRFVSGDRPGLRLETIERLADYLGLELRPKAKPPKSH